MRVWKRLTGVVIALLFCGILAGCNTFKGMGKDIEGGWTVPPEGIRQGQRSLAEIIDPETGGE